MFDKALELLKIFNDNGYEAYLVGGFVRDYVLGKKSADVDVCTNATPKQIQEIFKEVRLPFEQYGSVHLNYKKVNFEITTYRMDFEYEDKRKPSKIMYTDKLIIDLKRRDFTMNTLCMDLNGKIIDLLDGIKDIKDKMIRVVGSADKRLKEDSLRILRAIRFATELNFSLDDGLKEAIFTYRGNLKGLSYYRKKQELNRIFSSPNVNLGMDLLRYFGLSDYLGIDLSRKVVRTNDPIGIWAQVSPDDKYQFTSNEKTYLKAIKKVVNDGNISDWEIYREGTYVCYIAAQILKIDEVNIYDHFDSLPIKKTSDLAMNGKQIIDYLELNDKSLVKKIINDIERKVVLKKLVNSEDDIKKYLLNNYSNL